MIPTADCKSLLLSFIFTNKPISTPRATGISVRGPTFSAEEVTVRAVISKEPTGNYDTFQGILLL
jgi:hypothetical protein